MKIVVLEDEDDIAALIAHNLRKEGYEVASFAKPEDYFEKGLTGHVDLLVLDLMLPGMNGLEVLRRLRGDEKTRRLPIIIITARDTEGDRVLGLELGADDYITKPFGVREFLARVKAVLRRSQADQLSSSPQVISAGNVRLDVDGYRVTVNGENIELTRTEFLILKILMMAPGRAFLREELLEKLWGNEKFVVDRTIDVHVKKLRDKLKRSGRCIKTIRGVGYTFDGAE